MSGGGEAAAAIVPVEEKEKEVEDPNVIRVRVENVEELTLDGVQSEVKRINGFPWMLDVYRLKDELRVLLCCSKSSESAMWECTVNGEVKLVNCRDDALSIVQPISGTINMNDRSNNVLLLRWEKLTEADKIVVAGKGGERFRNLEDPDFFSPSNIADVILIVQEKKFHVSRQILAHQSSFFDALFYSDFKESKESEITLEDIVHEEFVVILGLVYNNGAEVFSDNVEFVLKLADQFNMKKVLDKAEHWLDNSSDFSFDRKVYLADKYNLHLLQIHCLKYIDGFDKISEVMTSEYFKLLSEPFKDDLMVKMLEMGMKK